MEDKHEKQDTKLFTVDNLYLYHYGAAHRSDGPQAGIHSVFIALCSTYFCVQEAAEWQKISVVGDGGSRIFKRHFGNDF